MKTNWVQIMKTTAANTTEFGRAVHQAEINFRITPTEENLILLNRHRDLYFSQALKGNP